MASDNQESFGPTAVQNPLDNPTAQAVALVLVAHAVLFLVVFAFETYFPQPKPVQEPGIVVEFFVVPEEPPASKDVEPAVVAEPEAEVKAEPVIDSEPEPVVAQPKPEPKPKPKIDSKPKPKSKPVAAAVPQTQSSTNTAQPTATTSRVAPKGTGLETASVLRRVRPSYPALSQRTGEEGRVVLNVLVKADGTAGDVGIKNSSGFQRLDKAAVSAVRQWRFEPYRVGGNAADHEYSVVVNFSLSDR